MKHWFSLLFLAVVSGAATACHGAPPLHSPLRLVQVIPLPGVEGRIDHFGMDLKRRQLLVAALGNNTLNVVDLQQGRVARQIGGFRHPQGVWFAPQTDRIFVANDDDGICAILDGSSLQRVGQVDFHDDADNIRYDPSTRQAVVGYGSGGLGFLDARSGRLLGRVPLAGHPESFQLESAGRRIYVNIPTANQIAVVDRARQKVVSIWPLGAMHDNFPMALDERRHRLLVGCRDPARMLVLDTASSRQITSVSIDRDTDDLYYDPARKVVYVSCGEGYVDVIRQKDADHYDRVARVQTAAGARTSLYVPELDRLYVAAPHRGLQRAEILVYAVGR